MALESEIQEITQALGRTPRPKAPGAALPERTIAERIAHIRDEIHALDVALADLQAHLVARIGVSG